MTPHQKRVRPDLSLSRAGLSITMVHGIPSYPPPPKLPHHTHAHTEGKLSGSESGIVGDQVPEQIGLQGWNQT